MKDQDISNTKAREFIKKVKEKAAIILKDPEQLSKLLGTARTKLKDVNGENSSLQGLIEKLNTFLRMIRAYRKGEYRLLPWKTLLMIVAGLLYFVMPLDLVPDFVPVLGYLDDLTIVVWIFNSLQKDIESFKAWEEKTFS